MLADLKRLRRNSSSTKVEVADRNARPTVRSRKLLLASGAMIALALVVLGAFFWRGVALSGKSLPSQCFPSSIPLTIPTQST